MTIAEKIKNLENELNLNKKFNNYFNKNVFRAALLLLVVILFIGLKLNDFRFNNLYIECEGPTLCKNPFYLCKNPLDLFEGCITEDKIPKEYKPYCDAGYCDNKYLLPGEIIGSKPNTIITHFKLIVFIVLICAFSVNHAFYVELFKKRLRFKK